MGGNIGPNWTIIPWLTHSPNPGAVVFKLKTTGRLCQRLSAILFGVISLYSAVMAGTSEFGELIRQLKPGILANGEVIPWELRLIM